MQRLRVVFEDARRRAVAKEVVGREKATNGNPFPTQLFLHRTDENLKLNHGLQLPVEGALLKGGEEGVQFLQLRPHAGLLLLDGFDNGSKAALERKRRQGGSEIFQFDPR